MRKILITLGIVLMFLSLIGGCTYEKSANIGINAEGGGTFAKMVGETLTPVKEPVFKRGENVYYVMFNVGPFEEGEDGKHWMDVDMQIRGPDKELVLQQENLLGEKGRLYFPEGYAKSPFGAYETTTALKPGRYEMTLSIYDRIGKGVVTKINSFELI